MVVDMVIKNGTVVVPNSSLRAHVIIDEGKVKELTPFDDLPKARETIDVMSIFAYRAWITKKTSPPDPRRPWRVESPPSSTCRT